MKGKQNNRVFPYEGMNGLSLGGREFSKPRRCLLTDIMCIKSLTRRPKQCHRQIIISYLNNGCGLLTELLLLPFGPRVCSPPCSQRDLFIYYFLGGLRGYCAAWLAGSLVPRPGAEPGPRQWKRQILSTGLRELPRGIFWKCKAAALVSVINRRKDKLVYPYKEILPHNKQKKSTGPN